MGKPIILQGMFAAALFWSASPLPAKSDHIPPRGFVPDAATAVAIARAVLIPIYGAEQIKSEEPLKARRDSDIWVVTGSNPIEKDGLPKFAVGGSAELKLSAKDGRILNVTHYQ